MVMADGHFGGAAEARLVREEVQRRLGPDMPQTTEAASSDVSPCDGWFAAANLCYQSALTAPDINTAIEWTIQGDGYSTQGELCQVLLKAV
jgi:hypothetical protein